MKDYDYSKNNAYYITICTYKRQQLFGEIAGAVLCDRPNNPAAMVNKWLFEIENKYSGVNILKYAIMPDHMHFILSLTGDHTGSPLPCIIDWFKTMTTNEYIRGVKSNLFPPFDRHIWQSNYYEHIIRNEQEYQEIWEYIDTNTLKWDEDARL